MEILHDNKVTPAHFFLRKIQEGMRDSLGLFLESRARLNKKKFYCKTLMSNGSYLAINCDLTVSCHCNDMDGSGTLGNLRVTSLENILSDEKAELFRESLLKGKLPISKCARCHQLSVIDKGEQTSSGVKFPQALTIENTSNCNLKCLACKRDLISKNRKRRRISIDDIEYLAKAINRLGVNRIVYINYGEPFLYDSILEEISLLRKYNPDIYIETSTNGTLINNETKLKAALLFDKILFSLDGSTNESVAAYQRGSNFEAVYKNMCTLVNLRDSLNFKKPFIEWKYVLFRWNDSKKLISQAIQLAESAKVDSIRFYPTLSPFYGISLKHYLGFRYLRKARETKLGANRDVN